MYMYDAKPGGRNGLLSFDPLMQTMISERAALELDLREDMKGIRPMRFALFCTIGLIFMCQHARADECKSFGDCTKVIDNPASSPAERAGALFFRSEFRDADHAAEAICDLKQAIALSPDEAFFRRNLALAYFQHGDANLSLDAFKQELEKDFKDKGTKEASVGTTLISRSIVYCRIGKIDEAEQDARKFRTMFPDEQYELLDGCKKASR